VWPLVFLLVLLLAGSAGALEHATSDTLPEDLPDGDPPDYEPATAEWVDMDSPDENEVTALGRVLHSECGGSTSEEREAIGWAVRQYAARRRATIYYLEHDRPGGWAAQRGSNPPFSSRQPARQRDLDDAAALLARPLSDAPDSADHFFEPALQDLLARRGAAYRADPAAHPEWERFRYYYLTAEQVRAKWRARGEVYIRTVGKFEFWR
jgi:hypothetical protein